MGYNEMSKKATMKYIRTKQQEIKVRYRKEEFEQEIRPAIERTGLPTVTYIKQAVSEKMTADRNKANLPESAIRGLTPNALEIVKKVTVESIPAVFQDDCRAIVLYGSCARGDFSAFSDIDIAIITESDRIRVKQYDDQIDEIAANLGIDTGAIVNYVCLPYQEFQERKGWYSYYRNIDREGVVLYERR